MGIVRILRKDSDGAIRVSDELTLQDAVRLVRGKSLFFASGFESFPQEFYDTFCKVRERFARRVPRSSSST